MRIELSSKGRNPKIIELEDIRGSKDVFISYKREDASYVNLIQKELQDHGIKPWFDLNELHRNVGDEYTKRIQNGIKSAPIFLLIYSKKVEKSKFIIENELKYAISLGKSIFVYPKEPIDTSTSKIAPLISQLQWLDTRESALYQNDTQEAIQDEQKKAELIAKTKKDLGFTIFDDQNIFLIRLAIQRKLNRLVPYGNYLKLCGTGDNEFYNNDNLKLKVINKSLFINVPEKYKAELQNLKFFCKDKVEKIETHLKKVNPDNTELLEDLRQFIIRNEDSYPMSKIRQWLKDSLTTDAYKSIKLPALKVFGIDDFLRIVAEMSAINFINDLKKKKVMFNGSELGVYNITDGRTLGQEHHFAYIDLYYSDYFTFKCMTEMYHILCSIDDKPLKVNSIQDIRRVSPFLCSLGMGGFISNYQQEEGISLLWAKRSGNISSGDMWHFSYDETVSLVLDSVKDKDDNILITEDNCVFLDPKHILFRALKEEVGSDLTQIESDHHGVFEVGIIKSERLEIELISSAILRLEKNSKTKNNPKEAQAEQSLEEVLRDMHDSASDGYLEISRLEFIPINDENRLIGRLLSPESLNIYKRMKKRLKDNVGRLVMIGDRTIIESGGYIGDNTVIGNDCKIHRNVFIGNNVIIGNNVKIQNFNTIYEGVTLEDGVFVGTNVSFTNDRHPRSILQDGRLKSTEDWKMEKTIVRRGAAIGSGAVIRCGVTIGEWAMVGCGAVVTKDVPHIRL